MKNDSRNARLVYVVLRVMKLVGSLIEIVNFTSQAGLAVLIEPMTFDLMNNKSAMDKVLAETEAAWEPGTAHGYHTLSIGPYVDALVRRADPKKRSIGKFFHEEVSKPFGKTSFPRYIEV